MDAAPKIMQYIQVEIRRGHNTDHSVSQFRSLRFILRNPESSLSDLADHHNPTLPSVSKLVDGLVKKDLISHQESTTDRRQLTLALTENGESIINSARASAKANPVKILSYLSNEELRTIHQAMELLYPLFIQQSRRELAKA